MTFSSFHIVYRSCIKHTGRSRCAPFDCPSIKPVSLVDQSVEQASTRQVRGFFLHERPGTYTPIISYPKYTKQTKHIHIYAQISGQLFDSTLGFPGEGPTKSDQSSLANKSNTKVIMIHSAPRVHLASYNRLIALNILPCLRLLFLFVVVCYELIRGCNRVLQAMLEHIQIKR